MRRREFIAFLSSVGVMALERPLAARAARAYVPRGTHERRHGLPVY